MNSIVPVAITLSFLGSAVFAQQFPTDAKILHDASAAIANEKAFSGLDIVPTVSHGTVTLTGEVSSPGDKVLAGMEVGQVRGVKVVLNNLDVGGAAQDQALRAEVAATFDDPAPAASPIPAGTVLPVRLVDPITTKTAKVGDQFHGTLVGEFDVNGTVVIPDGSTVLGRVVSAKPVGRWIGQAELSVELTMLQLVGADGKVWSVHIATDPLASEGKGSSAGVIAGALASGPSGMGNVTAGTQIELKQGAVLQFTTAAPITIPALRQ